jgi:uncharacterized protein (DUF885 family)
MKMYILMLMLTILLSACGDNDEQPTKVIVDPPMDQPVDDFIQQLANLTIDEFFQQSFQQLLLRDPELVLQEGLAEEFDLLVPLFTNISSAYRSETTAFYNAAFNRLKAYDVAYMTTMQRKNHDVYLWWLEDQIALMSYPQFQLNSLQALNLINFFIGLHPLESEEDAVNYLVQLNGLAGQYQAFQSYVKERQAKGVVDPIVLMEHVIGQLHGLVNWASTEDPVYQHFDQAVAALHLDSNRQQQLVEQVVTVLQDKIRPAQINLVQSLELMLPQAPTIEVGLGQFPLGADYYQVLLAHHLTASKTADQMYQLGLDELAIVQNEMRAAFDALGYPVDHNIEQLYQLLEENDPIVEPKNVVATFETLVFGAQTRLTDAFHIFTVPALSVVASYQDGYFPAANDGSEPGRFVTDASSERPYYQMPSLAYHEGIPGHHLQSSFTQSLQLPLIRTQPRITAYVEGWALYVEYLAHELDWYADDKLADLGRLQWQALRAARLVADIGVNTKGWSWDDSIAYLMQNTGLPEFAVAGFAARFVVNPGQATAYTFGMMELLAIREQVMKAQGSTFNLADFHQVILNSGPMPLTLLKQQFEELLVE